MCRKRKVSSIASCGRISSLRTSAASSAPDGRRRSGTSSRAPPLELEPDHGRALEHRRAPRGRARRGEQRGGPGWSAGCARSSPPSASIASSCSTNSGLPSATSPDPRARGRVERAAEQALDQLRRPRLARAARAGASGFSLPPPRPGARRAARAARGREAERCVARPVGEVLEEVEKRRLGPVDVLDHERPAAARARGARATSRTAPEDSSGAPADECRRRLVLGAGRWKISAAASR